MAALSRLSIAQLADLPVTSVTKRAEPISQAPAAIFVITRQDILRSGSTSLPEMLRLAPNLQVAQTGAGKYVITARGFSGNAADQSFSNKLLVLVDGRSVYTPLYSGVYWDMQDLGPDNIERIEVISGPGATLWGANAVNGVINIITRSTADTQGVLAEIGGGNLEREASLRYGGSLGDALSYRVYAKTFYGNDTTTATGAGAQDHWTKPQAGFRLDWQASPADAVTLEGDGYQGAEAQAGAADEGVAGANLTGRWSHAWQGGAALQVQAYYDGTLRKTQDGGGSFRLNTFDLDVQNSFALGAHNDIVWGGGVRDSRYRINGTASLLFSPASRTLDLFNLFAQDTIALNAATQLTLGLKLEDDPYSGVALLPDARLSWRPASGAMLWVAVSRAIRSPTPFDRDVVEKVGSTTFLTGGADFRPETLTAYETGARIQAASRLSFSASAFYNVYDDLRSIEPAPGSFIPLSWGNQMQGDTYGLEVWGDYRVASWWRLSPAFNLLYEQLKFAPGSSGFLGLAQAGDDPQQQASVKSSIDLGPAVVWDADLRYVGVRPDPRVPAYVELNMRLGWNVSRRLELSVSGFNLLHALHQEFPAPAANAVPRSVFAQMRWRF